VRCLHFYNCKCSGLSRTYACIYYHTVLKADILVGDHSEFLFIDKVTHFRIWLDLPHLDHKLLML